VNAYTISKLAQDAGVSTHIVRDYELRGLLCSCKCTDGGFRIYDEHALKRLQFVLTGKAAGISLQELSKLCKAMDANDEHNLKDATQRITNMMESMLQTQRLFKKQLRRILA